MLLTSQVQAKLISKDAEAFIATVVQFKIRIQDISLASGVDINKLTKLKAVKLS